MGTTPTRPRWGDEVLDRIGAVYDAEVLKHGGIGWALLPIEARLALVAVYCAGRCDGGR